MEMREQGSRRTRGQGDMETSHMMVKGNNGLWLKGQDGVKKDKIT